DLPPSHLLLQPVRVQLMELAAGSFRQAAVRRIADQDVAKPVGRLVHERGTPTPYELAADELVEQRRCLALRLGGERQYGTEMEELALDSAVLEQRSLALLQPVEPLGEQGVDRGRDRELVQTTQAHPSPVRRLPHNALLDEE